MFWAFFLFFFFLFFFFCGDTVRERDIDLLILNFAGLNPSLDLISVPLKLLDLLLQVGLELLLLIGIVRVVNLIITKKSVTFPCQIFRGTKQGTKQGTKTLKN